MKNTVNIFLLLLLSLSFFVYAGDFDNEFEESSPNTMLGIEWSGFFEFEHGLNISGVGSTQSGTDKSDTVLANRRLRLKLDRSLTQGAVHAKIDFLSDSVEFKETVQIREMRFQRKLGKYFDLSVGRQVLTWGVGDMLFINDLFPKDWIALFTGQEMEMLKLPTNTFRLTSYLGRWIFDFAYTPSFSSDRVPYGCHFGVFDPNSGGNVFNPRYCNQNIFENKDLTFENGEFSLMLKRRITQFELAFYAYQGYFKAPRGLSMTSQGLQGIYPQLSVWGASLEGQLGPGILSAETGYYYSWDDKAGNNLFIPNSLWKALAGYRVDLSAHWSIGAQYYAEYMQDYSAYEQSYFTNAQLAPMPQKLAKLRNTFTLRLSYKTQQDTLWFSFFSYYRPNDKDSFTKFEVAKDTSDQFRIVAGVNIFTGSSRYRDREFGMLKDADNVYLRMRYSF